MLRAEVAREGRPLDGASHLVAGERVRESEKQMPSSFFFRLTELDHSLSWLAARTRR